MLFPPPSLSEARRQMFAAIENGEIDTESACAQLLEADPHDFMALLRLGLARKAAGDIEGAEGYLWSAIHANPCVSALYFALAELRESDPAWSSMADGLRELALELLAREDTPEKRAIDFSDFEFEKRHLNRLQSLSPSEQYEMCAAILYERRKDEPAAVTERLRLLRLAAGVWQQDVLDVEQVDEIVAAGEPMVPLLMGIVRAWAQGSLPLGDDASFEFAVALLGEIASVSIVRELMQLVSDEDELAAGVSDWALGRLLERDPEGWSGTILPMIPSLDLRCRLSVLAHAQMRFASSGADALVRSLGENLDSLSPEERDPFFPLYLVSCSGALGDWGLALSRDMFSRKIELVSPACRARCEDLMAKLTASELPPARFHESTATVYEICSGETDWSHSDAEDSTAGDEFDAEEPDWLEPIKPYVRKQRPGRNDQCWCGSGKKYKKCHLDADDAKERAAGAASD